MSILSNSTMGQCDRCGKEVSLNTTFHHDCSYPYWPDQNNTALVVLEVAKVMIKKLEAENERLKAELATLRGSQEEVKSRWTATERISPDGY